MEENKNTQPEFENSDEFIIGKGFDLSIDEVEVSQNKNKKRKKCY